MHLTSLTFGAADDLVDLSARVEMQDFSIGMAFGGMRWFEFASSTTRHADFAGEVLP